MSDAEYFDWSGRYCAMFRADPERAAPMLHEWRGVFVTGGYSAAELHTALNAMAAAPPETDWQHLRAITSHLRQARTIQRKAQISDAQRRAESMGDCMLCGSSGYVVVPHPVCVTNDGRYEAYRSGPSRGVLYELAVYCRCALGEWLEGKHADYWIRKRKERGEELEEDRRAAWNIDRYERFNPDWKLQLAQLDDFEARLRVAETRAKASASERVRMFARALAVPK